jgi:hypothetical protein
MMRGSEVNPGAASALSEASRVRHAPPAASSSTRTMLTRMQLTGYSGARHIDVVSVLATKLRRSS